MLKNFSFDVTTRNWNLTVRNSLKGEKYAFQLTNLLINTIIGKTIFGKEQLGEHNIIGKLTNFKDEWNLANMTYYSIELSKPTNKLLSELNSILISSFDNHTTQLLLDNYGEEYSLKHNELIGYKKDGSKFTNGKLFSYKKHVESNYTKEVLSFYFKNDKSTAVLLKRQKL